MGRLIATAAVLAAALVPATAHAHGGSIVGTGRGSGYTMTIQAAGTTNRDHERLADLTAYPINEANGAPVTDGTVTFRINGGPDRQARLAAGAFELEVPMSKAGEWRRWQISATVRGPAGVLTVDGAPTAPESTDTAPGWAVPSIGALIALAVILLVRRRAAGRSGSSQVRP